MDTEQSGREYLEGLKRQIASMTPLEQMCSAMMLQFAEILLALVNTNQWEPIGVIQTMTLDLFRQLDEIRNEKRTIQ
jgi:hypothetical protein